jgi:hypothetical protein
VNDLDVYSFYAEHPRVPWPYRGRHGARDFGESEFGYHSDKREQFVGRYVDLLGRALPCELRGQTGKRSSELNRHKQEPDTPAVAREGRRGTVPGSLQGHGHLGPIRRGLSVTLTSDMRTHPTVPMLITIPQTSVSSL